MFRRPNQLVYFQDFFFFFFLFLPRCFSPGGEGLEDSGRQTGSFPVLSGSALDPSSGPVINTRFVEETWQTLLSTGLGS